MTADFDLTLYLDKRRRFKEKSNYYSFCLGCSERVEWRRDSLSRHIRARCSAANESLKKQFAMKRESSIIMITDPSQHSDHGSMVSASEESNSTFSQVRKRIRSQKTSRMTSVMDSMSPGEQFRLDELFAAWIYRTAIPFNAVDCEEFRILMKAFRPSYIPLTPYKLRTTFLDRAYDSVQGRITALLNKPSNIFTIVSDGWSNLRNEHMVNFILVTPGTRPILYKTIPTNGAQQTAGAISQELIKVIEEVGGPDKVAGVVTDHAPSMRAAWEIVEERYPTIYANGCSAHVLNLLIGDICSMDEYSAYLEKAIFLSKFIRNRSAIGEAFRILMKQRPSPTGKRRFPTLPVPTRWYSHVECVGNVLSNRSLFETIADDTQLMSRYPGDQTTQFKLAVHSNQFWEQAEELHKLLLPPSVAFGEMESDGCTLTNVNVCWKRLLHHDVYRGKDEVRELIVDRWNFLNTESVLWAVLLDPKNAFGDQIYEGGVLKDAIVKLLKHLEKYYSGQDYQQASTEVTKYRNFVRGGATETDKEKFLIPLSDWWDLFGSIDFPKLHKLARRLLALPTSSAASERMWSATSLVHSNRRNRLEKERVVKLVSVNANNRILTQRVKKPKTSFESSAEEIADKEIDYVEEQLRTYAMSEGEDDSEDSSENES